GVVRHDELADIAPAASEDDGRDVTARLVRPVEPAADGRPVAGELDVFPAHRQPLSERGPTRGRRAEFGRPDQRCSTAARYREVVEEPADRVGSVGGVRTIVRPANHYVKYHLTPRTN